MAECLWLPGVVRLSLIHMSRGLLDHRVDPIQTLFPHLNLVAADNRPVFEQHVTNVVVDICANLLSLLCLRPVPLNLDISI